MTTCSCCSFIRSQFARKGWDVRGLPNLCLYASVIRFDIRDYTYETSFVMKVFEKALDKYPKEMYKHGLLELCKEELRRKEERVNR